MKVVTNTSGAIIANTKPAERCSEPDPELLALRDEADAVAAPIMAKAEAVWSAHESEILKAFEERLREEEMNVDSLNEQHVSAGLDEEEINALLADLNHARDEADLNDAPILAEAERGWADIEWPEGAFTFINGDKK